MDTNRIRINNYDLSTTDASSEFSVVGYTVLKAPKGGIIPYKIGKGGLATLKDVFGASSKDYPDLYEAESFLADADLFISAPYDEGKDYGDGKTSVPVAYITDEGVFAGHKLIPYNKAIEELNFGKISPEIKGITQLDDSVEVLKNLRYPVRSNIDAEATDNPKDYLTFDTTENACKLIINTGIKTIKKDSTLVIRHVLDEDLVLKVSGTKLMDSTVEVGSISTEGVITLMGKEGSKLTATYLETNLSSEALWSKVEAYLLEKVNKENIYGVIYQKFPSTRTTTIAFDSFAEADGYDGKVPEQRNILKMHVKEEGTYTGQAVDLTGSLKPNAVLPTKGPIGFNNMNAEYALQESIGVYSIKEFSGTMGFTPEGYAPVTLEGGERVFPSDKDLYNMGWDEANCDDYHQVDIFFESQKAHKYETEKDTLSGDKFFELAKTHELSGYIFNYTVAPKTIKDGMTHSEMMPKKLSLGYNYWNICNEAIIRVDGTPIFSPMTGKRAGMQARILDKRFGGVAPMFLNDTANLGGQLDFGSGYMTLVYNYDKDVRDKLNSLNFNPVVEDATYGTLITGQKTCKYGELTDWSYISHTSSFLRFQKEVYRDVMLPQIGKPNNPYYRNYRAQQVNEKLRRRLEGANAIWAEGVVDTSTNIGVNDASALRARKFIINVRVKVYVSSEYVELNFTNVDQSMNV